MPPQSPRVAVPPFRDKPRLAITVGDVAGVGPELALACVRVKAILDRCQPILIGPVPILRTIAAKLSIEMPSVATIQELADVGRFPTAVIDCGDVSVDRLVPGHFTQQTGQASFLAVDDAIRSTLAGEFDAIVTGPIQKEAWHAAATGYLGHTELLADRTGTTEFCMMLSGNHCSTVLATIHLPLLDAIQQLSIPQIVRAIRLGGQAIQTRHGRPPRITVLGLNPHAGEHGLLSHGEEETLISPATGRPTAAPTGAGCCGALMTAPFSGSPSRSATIRCTWW